MLMPAEKLRALVDRRDACSGGGAEKCMICNLRHGCHLDEAGTAAETALRLGAALHAYYQGDVHDTLHDGLAIMAARRVAWNLLDEAGFL